MIIAVDGPAASGKGTLTRRLAEHFGLARLDTGLLYRAVGFRIIEEGDDPEETAIAVAAAERLQASDLNNPALRGEAAASAASVVAAIPEVRATLRAFQQNFAANPPGGAPGAVLDGRDIGTVICPGADIKLFLTASPEVRAERRVKELQAKGLEAIYTRILRDLQDRDARDASRAVSPLEPAKDALVIDTSEKDADTVFETALAHITSQNN
ncbi:MAG: (d)CMP kinase [Rhodospirillales bacterium]|nr:(d)CMP kinase [Rhodospirillales bacterium]